MSDFTDDRRGAYEPVNKDGLPQPPRVKDRTTPHRKEEWGGDVRPEPLPGTEPYYRNVCSDQPRPAQSQNRTKARRSMPKYFFHLAGQFPAHDLLGHECTNDKEAKDHGSFIAHRIGTEKTGMVREENFISVRNERDEELFQVPLASTTV